MEPGSTLAKGSTLGVSGVSPQSYRLTFLLEKCCSLSDSWIKSSSDVLILLYSSGVSAAARCHTRSTKATARPTSPRALPIFAATVWHTVEIEDAGPATQDVLLQAQEGVERCTDGCRDFGTWNSTSIRGAIS